MNWVVSLCLYFLVCIVSYTIIKNQALKRNKIAQKKNKKSKKISILCILLISVFFTLYNCYITISHGELLGDRYNYAFSFTSGRPVGSALLQLIYDVVSSIGGDIYLVFYFTTFICVMITLFAYKVSDQANYKVFLLLFSSQWLFYTVTNIKQCYAAAFASLFFVFVVRERNRKNILYCIFFAVLACLSHISGFILFPVLLFRIFMNEKHGWKVYLPCLAIVMCIIFLEPLIELFVEIAGNYIPNVALRMASYFNDSGAVAEGGAAVSIIKWLPFYYITILGVVNRKRLANIIAGYDIYLMISILASGLLLYSAFNYWFLRFAAIFYIPVYTYFVLINSKTNLKQNRLFNYVLVVGSTLVVFIRWFILTYVNYGGF